MRRRRWLWLWVPAVAIGWVASAPASDDFGDFAREGSPIRPGTVTDLLQNPPSVVSYGGVRLWADRRVRAWRLSRSAPECRRRFEAMGFRPHGGGSASSVQPGKPRFSASSTGFEDAQTGTEATVVESTKLPPGVGCVVLVQEPTGLGAAWRRFVARTKRGLGR